MPLTWNTQPQSIAVNLERRVRQGLTKGGKDGASLARDHYRGSHRWHNDSGATEGSIRATVGYNGTGVTISVGASSQGAPYVELGTVRNRGAYRSLWPSIQSSGPRVLGMVARAIFN